MGQASEFSLQYEGVRERADSPTRSPAAGETLPAESSGDDAPRSAASGLARHVVDSGAAPWPLLHMRSETCRSEPAESPSPGRHPLLAPPGPSF